jgi:hypothetical protein
MMNRLSVLKALVLGAWCLVLVTGCGLRREGAPSDPILSPTAPPAPSERAPAPGTPATVEETTGTASTVSTTSDLVGDEAERLLDQLEGELERTDTLEDSRDIVP